MSVVLAFAGVGVLLVLMGWAGRRNSVRLGAVPGMPPAHESHRIRVIHRGATTCLAVGVAFVVVGIIAPLL
ncbi:hypothetical protein Ae168Ps1_3033c [Pseudonocardia sp. Ae168_Ps1]|uniref:hypothetical protein n=1 Tax=unclassified Pseudonocardia TaxID=2619320 RepID=UPI00094AAF58|nr:MULTISPECIES: hypothetical protein [unclassified Pseudonocardia]OLL74647.1 hypothetical protein Ae150APs1_3025c [Pseudonocardia sp. Ae150A_Ps1]OLL80627.1 hypothetical protein Ae168Ps1_3033c [Pseudonocardia sp. Ae168_Ps1]OLL85245.1 hypothetical protein Ae263Ps1_2300 [Pseudonocardia sp. Ae263_Ps1]OLL94730.1 hypothetical protein Ae356Ps1_4627c [Pseudonocardia sp. Ae356_Ps1]